VSHAEDQSGSRRDFLYYATAGTGVVVTGAAVWPLVNQMNPSADVQAASQMRVDVSGVAVGTQLTVLFLGKPVFIRHRTEEEIAAAREVPLVRPRRPGRAQREPRRRPTRRTKTARSRTSRARTPANGWSRPASARTSAAFRSATARATSADGSAPATAPTTTPRAASVAVPPPKTCTSRLRNSWTKPRSCSADRGR
jgi:hypothetical protein